MDAERKRTRARWKFLLSNLAFYAGIIVVPVGIVLIQVEPIGAKWSLALFALSLLSFIWVISVLASMLYFPIKYSLVGRAKRRKWTPRTGPILSVVSGFSTGNLLPCAPSSIFRFRLFESGLEIRITIIGRVFLPLNCIKQVRKGELYFHYKLVHDHEEVRSPINFTNRKLFDALKSVTDNKSDDR